MSSFHGTNGIAFGPDGRLYVADFLGGCISAVDLATAEGRAGLLHEAKPLLRQMQATLLRVQLLRELGEKCRLAPGEVAQLLELAPKGAASRAPEPRYPRVAPAPIARALLRLLIANPTLAGAVTPEQQGLLDAAELAPVAELIGLVREGAIATPAMLIEATRDSSHSTLFQQVAGETMAGAEDLESAQAEWRGAFVQLELARVQGEYQRLTAIGAHSPAERERFHELSRRLAELIEQISSSTSREAVLANEVADNIQHIFAVTEQTGEGTRTTAQQVRELSHMAEELRQSVARFKIA